MQKGELIVSSNAMPCGPEMLRQSSPQSGFSRGFGDVSTRLVLCKVLLISADSADDLTCVYCTTLYVFLADMLALEEDRDIWA